jgi:hypothetical protein
MHSNTQTGFTHRYRLNETDETDTPAPVEGTPHAPTSATARMFRPGTNPSSTGAGIEGEHGHE